MPSQSDQTRYVEWFRQEAVKVQQQINSIASSRLDVSLHLILFFLYADTLLFVNMDHLLNKHPWLMRKGLLGKLWRKVKKTTLFAESAYSNLEKSLSEDIHNLVQKGRISNRNRELIDNFVKLQSRLLSSRLPSEPTKQRFRAGERYVRMILFKIKKWAL